MNECLRGTYGLEKFRWYFSLIFLCYRHLNNRSTGIKVYSLGINTYCLH